MCARSKKQSSSKLGIHVLTGVKFIGCDKRLTIEHILLTCSDFIETRESHFTAKSLRMLFQDISPEKIFNFLKEINILGFFLI